MRLRLSPYSAYKDSGHPRLGAVPAKWKVRSVGAIATPLSSRNRTDLPLLSVVRERGVIPRSSMTDDENHNFVPDDLSNYKVVHEGNLVINKMKAWQGSMGIADRDGIVSPAYFVYDFRVPNREFAHRLLRSRSYVDMYAQASDGVRIGQWDLNVDRFKRIPVLLPSDAEQVAICSFLDHADRRINRLMRAKRRLIELLNEQKQATIDRAVTRGLDPKVRLKSSGIDWLPSIPETWSPVRLVTLASSLQTGPFGSQLHADEYSPGGTPVINPSHLRDGRIEPDPRCAIREEKADELSRHRLQLGDFVFARRGELGRCALVTTDSEGWICGTGSLRVRLRQGAANADYLLQLFQSKGIAEWLSLQSVGSTMENLNTGILGRLPIPLPPKAEQRSIVANVRRESLVCDEAIDRACREIDLLREYRTRLIADVVTGKLDVRGVELPPLDDDEPLADIDAGDDADAEAIDDVEESNDAD